MAVVTSASAATSPPEAHYSEESTTSLCLRWRPSSSLVAALEASINLKGSAARLFLKASSSIGHFLLSPVASLSVNLDGLALAYYCGRAGRVKGAGLDGTA